MSEQCTAKQCFTRKLVFYLLAALVASGGTGAIAYQKADRNETEAKTHITDKQFKEFKGANQREHSDIVKHLERIEKKIDNL